MSLKFREDSITGIRLREALKTKTAISAKMVDGSIVLELPEGGVCDGSMVKFWAPCACANVTGGLVINGKSYTIVDAHCECVAGSGDIWGAGAEISVVIDDTNAHAYIQNGDTNSYLEGKFGAVKQALDALQGNAKMATGFYIGTGEVESPEPLGQITTDFAPKAVMLFNNRTSATSTHIHAFTWINGMTSSNAFDAKGGYGTVLFTLTDNTLSWHYDGHDGTSVDLTNEAGEKYFYVALG